MSRTAAHFCQRPKLCRFICLMFATTIFTTGCAHTSRMRQRWFQRETSVESPELTTIPNELPRRTADRTQPRPSPRNSLNRLGSRPGEWFPIGQSVERRPIEAMQIGSGPTRVLLIGGIHGDEPEGLPLVERLVAELGADARSLPNTTLVIIRDINPDGTASHSRMNSNGVDLNRNFPASNWDPEARSARFQPGTRPASEPETQILVKLIATFSPDRILVMHATRGKPMVNYDGPAREIAESMSEQNRYAAADSIGYPTPGSLGSYAGVDLQIPIITLELPRGVAPETAWRVNSTALLQFVR